jgi:hypothetical protein
VNKSARTVTIGGIEYSVDKCNEAVDAWEAEVAQRKASGKRFAKKSSGEVIGGKLASAAKKAMNDIPKDSLAKKPAYYTAKLEKMAKLMKELADLLDDLSGDKDASAEVKDFVKTVQTFIKVKIQNK